MERRPRKRQNRPMTASEKEECVLLYRSGMSAEEVGKKFGFRGSTVLNHVHSAGFHKSRSDAIRRYSLDESAFDKRLPEMAYWLGFIVTDGCVYHPKSKKPCSPRLAVALSERDRDHLVKLNAFLKCDGPILLGNGSASYAKPDRDRATIMGGPSAKVCYASRAIVSSLERHGVVPRKSTREAVPPGFADDSDFWRGAVDGDGWITYRRQGKTSWHIVVGLCGSADLCNGFRKFAINRIGRNVPDIRNEKKIWYAKVSGRAAIELIRIMYFGAPVSLDRKQAKADEVLRIVWPVRIPRPCSVNGCDRSVSGRDLCHMHLKRLLKHGDASISLRSTKPKPRKSCSAPGCDRDHFARGFCRLHYRRDAATSD